jgi:hypothetical protein
MPLRLPAPRATRSACTCSQGGRRSSCAAARASSASRCRQAAPWCPALRLGSRTPFTGCGWGRRWCQRQLCRPSAGAWVSGRTRGFACCTSHHTACARHGLRCVQVTNVESVVCCL